MKSEFLLSVVNRIRSLFARKKKVLPPENPPVEFSTVEADLNPPSAWQVVCSVSSEVLAAAKGNPDLASLIEDRMAGMQTAWQPDLQGADLQHLVLLSVDFYDELGWLEVPPAEGETAENLERLRNAVSLALVDVGAELIHRPQWDSSLQRAISIERTVEQMPVPKILRYGRSGVKLASKLLRKQEVVLLSS